MPRRLRSPPPYPYGLRQSFRNLGWRALQDVSPLHRFLFTLLMVIITAAELLRLDDTDTRLTITLGVGKLALVVDCMSVITHHLGIMAYRVPFVAGPLSEFELVRLMLADKATSSANLFLVGCAYTKPLVAGALCFALHGLQAGWYGMQPPGTDLSHVSQMLLRSVLAGVLLAYLLGLRSLPIPTATTGDRPWLSQGVLLFLLVFVLCSCYFWRWNAHNDRDTAGDRSYVYQDSEWMALLVLLVALKIGAARLLYTIITHWHAEPLAAGQDTNWAISNTVVHFVLLPLIVVAIDHLADIGTAYRGDIQWSWMSLCQSALGTLLFTRPFFALIGYGLDPWSGCMGIALCFLSVAVWLSLSAPSRKVPPRCALNEVADICRSAQSVGVALGLLGRTGCLCSSS